MRILKSLSVLAAIFLTSPLAAQQLDTAPAPVNYANEANWLCLPGRADPCGTPLPTTALNANGYGSNRQSVPATDPGIDCFYVYPTISEDAGANSDMVPGPEEKSAATVQFARFSTVCRTFAPMYRQVTLAALRSTMIGKPQGNIALAYGDVLSAWRHYLQNHNQGRPFVIIGHSQGTVMLSQLLSREIEGSPAAARMLSAVLIGFNVEVPEGKIVGGTFKQTPLCTKKSETGCVVTYVSFRGTNPPPPIGLFGRSTTPGMTVACTNPAGLGSRGSVPLNSYWYAGPSNLGKGPPPITWSPEGAPPTPFLRTEGLASAACVNRGPLGYLSVIVKAAPNDARTDAIPGDVYAGGSRLAGWGLHLADMNLALGDLVAMVEAQGRAFARH
ncbi:MAG: DUF3089 domain-containing protein [Sphingosinicella sp.]|nr:DUF3089 domain-containing protein [Sphingosinicella sp.]